MVYVRITMVKLMNDDERTFSPKFAKVSACSTVILCVPSGPLARISIFVIIKSRSVVAVVEG
jgi:hypothetical protein